MFKVVSLLALVFVTLFFAVQYDDKPSSEVESLVARFTDGKDSEAYLFLLGIYVQEGDDPVALGRQIFESNSSIEQSEGVFDYPESKKLSLPDGDGFCSFEDEDCIGFLFSGSVRVAKLIEHHWELLERSDRFFQYDEYRTMAQPKVDEIFPEYKYLLRAQRIRLLEAIDSYKRGDVSASVESLVTQFSVMRSANERQDNLVGKLVLLIMQSDILEVLSVILSESGRQVAEIARLSASEKDFGMVSAREFGILYYGFKSLDKHPQFFELKGEFSNAPEWLVRAAFKPNMTINALAPLYLLPEKLAALSPAEFAQEVADPESYTPSTSVLRNPAGNVLLGIEGPAYEEYVARFHDLDVKISLFNQLYYLGLDTSSLTNPYHGSETPTFENGRLCFSGPMEDKSFLRCLSIEL
ncbi:MAG: hypothetical protein VXZ24_12460 [Pseudomonadota bacterium]|nr:hypothetical protein [Pseudomonadota bacterium]